MSQIVTLTFNPCIDKSTSVDSIVPEKKLRCAPPKFEPGGGGINVSRALKKLGSSSLAIYPAGGHTGSFLQTLLKDEQVATSVIPVSHYTRENLVVVDRSNNQQFRFGMPGSPLSDEEWKACLRRLEEINDVEFIVASGSLPPGVPESVFAQLSQIARAKNAKLIVDTSGKALKYAVEEGVYLLKPNIGELSSLVNKEEIKRDEVQLHATELIAKGKAEVIVVSLGAAGALLVTADIALQFAPPLVKRQSTVGAGDSMVAGIVYCLSKKQPIAEAVRYGIACGTAATMNPGTELCKLSDVQELLKYVKVLN